MTGIITNPNKTQRDMTVDSPDGETRGFTPIGYANIMSPKDKFTRLLKRKEFEASGKRFKLDGTEFQGVFAFQVAKMEFQDKIDEFQKAYKRENQTGKVPSYGDVDLDKYMLITEKALKENCELVKETEINNSDASKKYPFRVDVKSRTYKWKGNTFKYTILEDHHSAVARCKKLAGL